MLLNETATTALYTLSDPHCVEEAKRACTKPHLSLTVTREERRRRGSHASPHLSLTVY
jgi:hypothetical protein